MSKGVAFHEVAGSKMVGNTLDPSQGLRVRKLERKSPFTPEHGMTLAPRERHPAYAAGAAINVSLETILDVQYGLEVVDPLEELLREEREAAEDGGL